MQPRARDVGPEGLSSEGFVTGHDFSRAANVAPSLRALAPATSVFDELSLAAAKAGAFSWLLSARLQRFHNGCTQEPLISSGFFLKKKPPCAISATPRELENRSNIPKAGLQPVESAQLTGPRPYDLPFSQSARHALTTAKVSVSGRPPRRHGARPGASPE